VDFKEIRPPTTVVLLGVTTVIGSFYVNWEDSEWGGDFDQDNNGVLTYMLTNSGLTIQTDVIGDSTPYKMGFGYSLNGTTDDGFHAHSGNDNFSYTNASGVVECNNCTTANAATSKSYTLSASAAGTAVCRHRFGTQRSTAILMISTRMELLIRVNGMSKILMVLLPPKVVARTVTPTIIFR